MRTSGVSMPEVVREIITRNRSIYDCMKMDVINFTALAVKIQPDVEKTMGGPVHLNTIVVAIKRYADSFETTDEMIDDPVLKDARLTLTDGIMGLSWNMTSRSDVMAFVTEILHYNGIDMADALFTQDGLVIVLKEEDAPRAYEKLRAQISR